MDVEEELHFQECIIAFREYYRDMEREIVRRVKPLTALGKDYGALICPSAKPTVKFDALLLCSKQNQKVLDKLIERNIIQNDTFIFNTIVPMLNESRMISITKDKNGKKKIEELKDTTKEKSGIIPGCEFYTKPHLATKIRSLLHQISREWSAEGKSERDACFSPILNQLEQHLKKGARVLCPGMGLGRLIVEIVASGYSCQGNEFSYIMLLASDYILNQTKTQNELSIHPWIDSSLNIFNTEDQYRTISFPDVSISSLTSKGKAIDSSVRMSVVAGEFLSVYQPDKSFDNASNEQDLQSLSSWDCIVSCFFIDTAPNVFDYIQRFFDLLKPGGIWVNHGPLLWHWCSPMFTSEKHTNKLNSSDSRYGESIELSYEELKYAIEKIGFKFLHESRHETGYSSNQRSMMQTKYQTVLFTCVKPIKT